MKVSLEIQKIDIANLMTKTANANIEVVRMVSLDEDDRTILEPYKVTLELDQENISFLYYLGEYIAKNRREITDAEEEDLQAKYEYDNDL